MATRRRLDRAAVVEAAELLVDRDGAAQLTMTALANELEIRSPSLYSHVANLEELLSLVQNRALAELDRAGLYPRSEVDVDAVYAQATELVLHVMEQAAPIELRVD